MNLNQLRDFCHGNAVSSGWWNDPKTGDKIERNKAELICLMHSELSECMEGVRKNIMDDKLPHRKMEEVELADVIIRIMDYCGAYELDIEGAVNEKILYNKNREDHKSENRLKENGKKF
jgi:NTP pyrophosphatase (non-canonical NTP hydrolase)